MSYNKSTSGMVHTKLTALDYTAQFSDYYIGATNLSDSSITITLPLGSIGKVYIIKNQGGGGVKVIGTSQQKIDTFPNVNLSSESGIMTIFDGARWNII